MRYVWIAITALLALLLIAFALVNGKSVELDLPFINFSITAPLFIILVVTYLLGMVSGGSVIGFFRTSIQRATETEPALSPKS